VLIELNLIQSLRAYSVMVATILIDVYLLYNFLTARRLASMRLQNQWAPLTRGGRRRSNMTELRRGPFDLIFDMLGYVIAIAAIAMVVYTVSLWPT
jgi:hypothetical protein